MSSFFKRHKTGLLITAGIIILLLVAGSYVVLSSLNSARTAPAYSNDISRSGSVATREGGAQAPATSVADRTANDRVSDSVDVEERKVIRNGSLSLVVSDIDETADSIISIANEAGGFLEYSDLSNRGSERIRGSMTIRVPADSFSNVFEELKSLAVRVEREQTDARDVTDQFVDLEARLRNAQRTEEQYLAILEQAESVEDTLKVQERLSQTREEIERLQAQRTQLSRQIEMASISISLISEGEVEIFGFVWSPMNQIKQGVNNLVEGLITFVNTLISVIFALPVIILWILLIAGVLVGLWKGGRRFKEWAWDEKGNDINDNAIE